MLPIFKGEWAVPYRASAKLEWCLTLGGRAEVEDVACSDIGAVPWAVLSGGTLPMGSLMQPSIAIF